MVEQRLEVQILELWKVFKMTLFSSGYRPTKTFMLNDVDGVDKVVLKNAHGFEVGTWNSKGKITAKGGVGKR